MGDNYNRGWNGSSPDPYSSNYYKDGEWYRGYYDRIDHDASMAKLWGGSSSSAPGGGNAWGSSFQTPSYSSSPSASFGWGGSSPSSTWSTSGSSDSGEGLAGLLAIGLLIAFWKIILMVVCGVVAIGLLALFGTATWRFLIWFVGAEETAQWITAAIAITAGAALTYFEVGPWLIRAHASTVSLCLITAWMWMCFGVLMVPLRRSHSDWAESLFIVGCTLSLLTWTLVLSREVVPALARSAFSTPETFFAILWFWVGALFACPLLSRFASPSASAHTITVCAALPMLLWSEMVARLAMPRAWEDGFSTGALAILGLWLTSGLGLLAVPLSRIAPRTLVWLGIAAYSHLPALALTCVSRNFPAWLASLRPVEIGVWIFGLQILGWLLVVALTVSSVVVFLWLIGVSEQPKTTSAATWFIRALAFNLGGLLIWNFLPPWFAADHGIAMWAAGTTGWILWLAALWGFGNLIRWVLEESSLVLLRSSQISR